MNFEFISIFSTAIATFTLGLFVLLKNTKANVGITFFAITCFASLWATFSYLSIYATSLDLAIFFNNLAYLWAYLSVLSFAMFSMFFPKKQNLSTKTLKVLVPVAILLGLFCLSPPVVGTYTQTEGGLLYTYGDWLPVELFILICLMAVAAVNLSKVAKIHHTREGIQARIILDGFSLCIIFGIICVGIIPMIDSTWNSIPFIPPILLLLIGVIAYTILRHGLFDIRPIIARSVAYILSIFFAVCLFVFAAFGLSSILIGNEITLQVSLFFAIFSIIIALIFQPVRKFFDKLTNEFFYRDAYDPEYVLNTINSTLASTLDLNSLLFATSQVVKDNLKLAYCNFFIEGDTPESNYVMGTDPDVLSAADINSIVLTVLLGCPKKHLQCMTRTDLILLS